MENGTGEEKDANKMNDGFLVQDANTDCWTSSQSLFSFLASSSKNKNVLSKPKKGYSDWIKLYPSIWDHKNILHRRNGILK